MQEFLTAWVEIEWDRVSRNDKLNKIRVEHVPKSSSEHLVISFQFAETDVHFPYAYWGNTDFSRALGQMVELMLKKHPHPVQIEKVPDKLAYDFYLSAKSWGE